MAAAAVEPMEMEPAAVVVDEKAPKKKNKKEKPEPIPTASCGELFRFASFFDIVLMLVGSVAAITVGVALPLFIVIFADLLEAVGGAATGLSLDWNQLLTICLTMFILGVVAQLCGWLYGTAFDLAKERQVVQLKKDYLKAIIRQDVGWYDTSNPQELPGLIGSSTSNIAGALGASCWQVFEFLGMGISGFVVSLMFGWDIALVMIGATPLVAISGALLGYVEKVSTAKISNAYARSGGIASESLSAIRTVASFGLEPTVSARYDAHLHLAQRAAVTKAYLKGLADALLFGSGNGMMAIGMLYAGYMVYQEAKRSTVDWWVPVLGAGGESNLTFCSSRCDPYGLQFAELPPGFASGDATCPYSPLKVTCATSKVLQDFNSTNATIGDFFFLRGAGGADGASTFDEYLTTLYAGVSDFVSFFSKGPGTTYVGCGRTGVAAICGIFGLVQGAQGLGFMGNSFSAIAKGRQATHVVLKTVSRIPLIDAFDSKGETPAAVEGAIEVKDVHFAYPSAPDRPVCKGYSLKIDAGSVCALCGPSGSGKSTIIQLIERFYDPQSGVVMLDGRDIKELSLKWLRQQLGLVGQEPVLFVGTVAENIGYGKEGATQEEIEEAAKAANAHTFIMENLGDKYKTDVGIRGGKLSGGQKQRVAIARALVRKPSVLLLDEATSALDNESERIVQAALDEIMAKQKRTTVVIAHRLSTIRNADKIAVVKSGRIVEEGDHEGLINLEGGTYAQLVKLQEGTAHA